MKPAIQSFRNRTARLLVIAALVAGAACSQGAQPPPSATPAATPVAITPAAPTLPDGPNVALLAGASPFEDMTESALNNDAAGVDKALKAYLQHSARVDAALSADQRQGLETRIDAIGKARGAGDFSGVALNAVEAYGTLVAALQPQGLKVPVQVSNLDYAGFKLKVLMHGTASDWSGARAGAQQADADWSAIKADVAGNPGLLDAMNVAVDGMNQATASENREMGAFAAEVDLALVDLLEVHFEGK